MEDICTFCDKKSDSIKLCGRCFQAKYCNKYCQLKHWFKEHKNICNSKAKSLFCSVCLTQINKPFLICNICTNQLYDCQECFEENYLDHYLMHYSNSNEKIQFELSFYLEKLSNSNTNKASYLMRIGDIYQKLGIYSKSYNSYKKSLSIYTQISEISMISILHFRISKHFIQIGNYQKALESLQKIQINKNSNHFKHKTSYHCLFGLIYRHLKLYNKSIQHYIECLDFIENYTITHNNLKFQQSEIYYNLGLVYRNMNEFQQAIECFTKCQNLSSDYPLLLAQTNNALGLCYDDIDHFQQSIDYYTKSLEIYRGLHNLSGQAKEYSNISAAFHSHNDLPSALENQLSALNILNDLDDKYQIAMANNNLSNIYLSIGQPKLSRDYAKQALELFSDLNHKIGQALSYSNLGTVYRHLQQNCKSQSMYEKALKICQECEYDQTFQKEIRTALEELKIIDNYKE